jgi:AbrB family looped-hinge helix DNA binding protein
MGYETSLSAKGQVVIPKDVRDALGLREGARFEVHMMGPDIVFRTRGKKVGRTTDEILAELRARHPYNGPAVSLAEMNETIEQSWIESALRSDT